ncbi:MAG: prolipoprotein diacylglyceryl transferase [Patescibacteria group bacterium]|jgi:prolipoprotein diacylglyceryl transferase
MIPYFTLEYINLGPVKIFVWGLFQAFAFLLAWYFANRLAKEKKINTDHILNLVLLSLIGGFVGGRIFYLIQYHNEFKNFWDIFKVWEGGMVFYGGLILAFILDLIYIFKQKLNFWKVVDVISLAMSFGLFVGRIGCFLIHDHLGIVMKNVRFFGINMGNGVVRHETAMYESLLCLLFFVIFWLLRKKIKTDGVIFASFLIWYSFFRFLIIDMFRNFDVRYFNLTISQWISILVAVIGLIILIKLKLKNNKKNMNEERSGKSSAMFMPLAIVIAGAIIAGAIIFSNKGNDVGNEVKGEAKQVVNTNEEAVVDVSTDDDPIKGDKNAKITIVEFSDFECPFCEKAEPTLKKILDTYSGKVKLVYRDFPLAMHKDAQKAAEASQCANDQGKYWEYHDKLYANQKALTVADLKKYAGDLKLDTVKFNQCLDSNKFADEVKKDLADGEAVGVDGTPAFFINGRKIVGAQPFEAFKQIIDEELKSL